MRTADEGEGRKGGGGEKERKEELETREMRKETIVCFSYIHPHIILEAHGCTCMCPDPLYRDLSIALPDFVLHLAPKASI